MIPSREKKKEPTNEMKLMKEGTRAAIKMQKRVTKTLKKSLKIEMNILDLVVSFFLTKLMVRKER